MVRVGLASLTSSFQEQFPSLQMCHGVRLNALRSTDTTMSQKVTERHPGALARTDWLHEENTHRVLD